MMVVHAADCSSSSSGSRRSLKLDADACFRVRFLGTLSPSLTQLCCHTHSSGAGSRVSSGTDLVSRRATLGSVDKRPSRRRLAPRPSLLLLLLLTWSERWTEEGVASGIDRSIDRSSRRA